MLLLLGKTKIIVHLGVSVCVITVATKRLNRFDGTIHTFFWHKVTVEFVNLENRFNRFKMASILNS